MWLRITLAAAFSVCAEDELHSMAPRSYLDHPHNVRHEHLCQYNRLAVSCDVVHPDHLLLPCSRWQYHNIISCDVSECLLDVYAYYRDF